MIDAGTPPTLRCLREDLDLPVPPASTPLDEIDHPLLNKAGEQFADCDTPHERIRAIDDVVLFKAKIGRWRGAVFTDQPDAEIRDWLVAAGTREDGSKDDFYAILHAQARTARQRYNAEHDTPLTTDTYVGSLLPGQDDHDRYLLEAGTLQAQTSRPTYLVIWYSSMPSKPPSRPRPEALTPPKGAAALDTRPRLRPTMPVSRPSLTRKPRLRSLV